MTRIVDASEIVDQLGKSKSSIRGTIMSLEVGKAAIFESARYESISSIAYTIGRKSGRKFSIRKMNTNEFAVIRKA